ncbi:MAG: zinc-ribbon domain-containing protein, partial [Clostridium sp.]
MICKNCGNLIPDSSPFCPICGRRDPDTYSIKNPYAPPSPFSSPAPPPQQVYGLPLQQQPGVSPRTGSQLPDPNIYYPVPPVAKRHTKS